VVARVWRGHAGRRLCLQRRREVAYRKAKALRLPPPASDAVTAQAALGTEGEAAGSEQCAGGEGREEDDTEEAVQAREREAADRVRRMREEERRERTRQDEEEEEAREWEQEQDDYQIAIESLHKTRFVCTVLFVFPRPRVAGVRGSAAPRVRAARRRLLPCFVRATRLTHAH